MSIASPVVLATLLALVAPLAPADDPVCAWDGEVTAATTNVLFPENHAAYWSMNYVYHPGLTIELDGVFPDARFMSLTVYKGAGGAFDGSTLTDYQITPDHGSQNPWQHPGHAGGKYTVRLVGTPHQGNDLPLAPAGTPDGTAGKLVFRVYLPASGDFDAVTLPSVTVIQDGVRTPLPPCTRAAAFNRPPADLGLLPNTDTGYVATTVTPTPDDQVLVIRAQAPRSAHGVHPSPWPARGLQLRYWSLCDNLNNTARSLVVNTLGDGSQDFGCRDDDETTVGDDGFYTYVVGTESQRAEISQIPGVTFVPWSAAHPHAEHVIFLRYMLADPHFAEAAQNITVTGDPAAAEAVMGDYYPQAGFVPLGTLLATVSASGTPALNVFSAGLSRPLFP